MKGKRKHTPQRTCIICRRTFPKRELTRIVRTAEGVRIDPTGKLAGRGAYVCSDRQCWLQLSQGNALARALKTQLTPADRAIITAEAETRQRLSPPPGPQPC
ncbi:MAG: YlxR family protein [Chloroflexi bacterium]|nr:YlxR family protein [Chloroflexota bacterium]